MSGCYMTDRQTTCEARCSKCAADEVVLSCKGTNKDQELKY